MGGLTSSNIADHLEWYRWQLGLNHRLEWWMNQAKKEGRRERGKRKGSIFCFLARQAEDKAPEQHDYPSFCNLEVLCSHEINEALCWEKSQHLEVPTNGNLKPSSWFATFDLDDRQGLYWFNWQAILSSSSIFFNVSFVICSLTAPLSHPDDSLQLIPFSRVMLGESPSDFLRWKWWYSLYLTSTNTLPSAVK